MARWTAHRWGTVIAAAVHAEMRQTHPMELSETDPILRRAVGRAIQREVTKALKHISASAQPPCRHEGYILTTELETFAKIRALHDRTDIPGEKAAATNRMEAPA